MFVPLRFAGRIVVGDLRKVSSPSHLGTMLIGTVFQLPLAAFDGDLYGFDTRGDFQNIVSNGEL